jgi:predicted metal-dependent hydrolase
MLSVAVPLRVSDEAVRLAVVTRLGWIKRQRARFEAQPRQSRREMVTGESHYVWGRRYRLNVIVHDGPAQVTLRSRTIGMQVRPGTTTDQRVTMLNEWHRHQLRAVAGPLLDRWHPRSRAELTAGRKSMVRKRVRTERPLFLSSGIRESRWEGSAAEPSVRCTAKQ